LVPGLSRK